MAAAPPLVSFTPYAIFESTLNNAQMLTDSMDSNDLVLAFRCSARLQERIVESLNRCGESMRAAAAQAVAEREAREAQARQRNAVAQHNQSKTRIGDAFSGILPVPSSGLHMVKFEGVQATQDVSEQYHGSDSHTSLLYEISPNEKVSSWLVKEKNVGVETREELDDVMVLGDECDASNDGLYAGGSASCLRTSNKVSNECRNLMRSAYKFLKGTGPHLFDFSHPFSHKNNQSVVQRIVDHAKSLYPMHQWSDEEWIQKCSNSVYYSFKYLRNREQDPLRYSALRSARNAKSRRKQQKMQRRSRALQMLQVRGEIDIDELPRFQLVLQREFTSSDDEDTASGIGDTVSVRVRRLAWQSDTVERLKTRLDTTFYQMSSERQKVELPATVRHEDHVSARPAPTGAPNWALKNCDSIERKS